MGVFIRARLEAEAHRLIAQAVPVFQHQQFFTRQIGHRHTIAIRPRVILIDRQHHGFIKQRHFDKRLALFHQRQDHAVKLATVQLRQQLVRLRFMQIHFQLREGLMQHRNNMRQQIRANRWDQADMQWARHRLTLLACHLLEHFDLTQHGARLIHQQ